MAMAMMCEKLLGGSRHLVDNQDAVLLYFHENLIHEGLMANDFDISFIYSNYGFNGETCL